MRIGVIGTGAIGGTIAALLDRAGHEVTVTARGENRAAIAESGLALDGAWGEHTAQVAVGDILESPVELAFVCTKAQDAPAAISANAAVLGGIPVVIVQNGLDGLDAATKLLPDSACIGALAVYAANHTAPGRFTVTATGNTYLGSGPGEPTHQARAAALTLNEAMPAFATANFVGSQWTKLVINEVNALPAITGLSVQETIGDRAFRRVITAAMRETVRLALAIGIRFGPVQGLSHGLLRIFAASPLGIGQLLPLLMARRMGGTPNLGSTLQSLRRGRRTEIDYLSGAVVAAARTAGRSAPVNAALVALVHDVEQTGRFSSRERIIESVAL